MNKLTDSFVLSNGVKVPCLGYGTFQAPDGEITKNCGIEALKIGYRHIDTAFALLLFSFFLPLQYVLLLNALILQSLHFLR